MSTQTPQGALSLALLQEKLLEAEAEQLEVSPDEVTRIKQQVAQISRRLKILARELLIPVVALAQVNRGSEDRQDHKPRLSDLRAAAAVLRGRHVAPHVTAWVVPGSENIKRAAEAEGLRAVFEDAGFGAGIDRR